MSHSKGGEGVFGDKGKSRTGSGTGPGGGSGSGGAGLILTRPWPAGLTQGRLVLCELSSSPIWQAEARGNLPPAQLLPGYSSCLVAPLHQCCIGLSCSSLIFCLNIFCIKTVDKYMTSRFGVRRQTCLNEHGDRVGKSTIFAFAGFCTKIEQLIA